MAKAKGKSAPQHSEAEKIALSKKICEIYETQNCTLDSACEAVGITSRSFYLWAVQISEISETYKKAKSKAEEHFFEERLKPKLMRSIERLVDERDEEKEVLEELAYQGVKTGDSRKIVTKSKADPNVTAVIFAMKGLFKERFAELSKTESTLTIVNGAEMSPEDYAQLKAIADKA